MTLSDDVDLAEMLRKEISKELVFETMVNQVRMRLAGSACQKVEVEPIDEVRTRLLS